MSDAFTDIARDQERVQLYDEYLESLRAYLLDPTAANCEVVRNRSRLTDNVPRGYFGGQTSIARDVDDLMQLLRIGNKDTWARFLFNLKDDRDFQAFKALSPFAGKMIIAVDYGCGFVNFHGDIEPLMKQLIGKVKGWKTYDADDYLVVLDEPGIQDAEVHWFRCGISGVSGPRNVK